MDLKPYSAPKVPSDGPEHFALFLTGILAIVMLVVDFKVFRYFGIERALSEAAYQSLLLLPFLLPWGLLKYRRMKAERRKAEFFERLRAALEDDGPCAKTQGS